MKLRTRPTQPTRNYYELLIVHCFFIFWGVACSKSDTTVAPPAPPPLPPPTPVQPAGYYISLNGNDSNAGTREKPFKTINKVNTLDLQPGETVYFEGGSTFEGTLRIDTADKGNISKPVAITSYGPGTATIYSRDKEAIIINSPYFEVKNINVKGAGRKEGSTSSGISLENASYGLLEQITAEGFQKSGLQVINSKNITIQKLRAHNNGFCGIYVTGLFEQNGRVLLPGERTSRNITIRDCTAENNPGDPTNLTNHSGNGIFIESTDGCLVEYCMATNNGWDMPHTNTGPIGIWASSCDSLIIQHCISYANKTSNGGLDGGGFGIDGGVTNSVIQYCLSYDNTGAGYGIYHWSGASPWKNNTVRYSVSINDAKNKLYGSFCFWNGTGDSKQFANCQVYNNVVYNTSNSNVVFMGNCPAENFVFYNNIFVGTAEIIRDASSSDRFVGNDYWPAVGNTINFSGYNTLEAWANATGQEMLNGVLKGRYTDPLFKGPFTTTLSDPKQLKTLTGYQLQQNSPLRDAGLNLKTLFNIPLVPFDFFGNTALTGNAPEPGIHELN